MHKKIIMACMAIAAFAAIAAPSASAIHLREGSTTGTTVGAGTSITAVNVGNTLFTAGNLTVTCTSAHMSGTITKDENTTISGEVAAGNPTFSGTHSTGDCTSGLGNVKPSVQSKLCFHTPNGTDDVEITGCGANITFTLNVTGVVTCKYQAARIIAEATTDSAASPKDAQIGLTEEEAVEEGGLFLCPDSGKLDMEYQLSTTDGTTLVFTAT